MTPQFDREEAGPTGAGFPATQKCTVCGGALSSVFGVAAHFDCVHREGCRQSQVESLTAATDGGDLGEHAVAYARAGLAVLPLRPKAKVPACLHGKDDATTDLDRIARWWKRHPDHNIGVRPTEGMVVLDVDPRNGGDLSLGELTANRPLPTTWTARTGSGGQHVWLRAQPPFRGQLAEGIDLKSHTGYLVMPPSVHPCGGMYQWTNAAPIAHAPVWLRPMLAPPSGARLAAAARGGGATGGLVETVAAAGQGNRNKALFWAARRAAEEGTLPALTAELVAAAISSGLPDNEVRATIHSAERSAHGSS